MYCMIMLFFSSRRRHTILQGDWSSDVCSSDLAESGLRHSGAEGLVRLEYAEANLIQQRNRCGRLSELVERLCLDQHDFGEPEMREVISVELLDVSRDDRTLDDTDAGTHTGVINVMDGMIEYKRHSI